LLQAQEANVKIVFPIPLTGPYGTVAQDQVRAGQFALAQFSDAGGRFGSMLSKKSVFRFGCLLLG